MSEAVILVSGPDSRVAAAIAHRDGWVWPPASYMLAHNRTG